MMKPENAIPKLLSVMTSENAVPSRLSDVTFHIKELHRNFHTKRNSNQASKGHEKCDKFRAEINDPTARDRI